MQTIEISNIDDYCQKVEEIRKVKDRVYFRGEPSFYKHRIPSLFRPRAIDRFITLCLDNVSPQNYNKEDERSEYIANNAEYEKTLIDKAQAEYTQAFFDCKNFLDELLVMQHYEMPTRLLDVTFNPLVALFFSCDDEDNSGKDGYIYWGNRAIDDMQNVKIIASLVEKLPNKQNNIPIPVDTFDLQDIKMWLLQSDSHGDIIQMRDKDLIDLITSNFLITANTTERMRNQSGTVIISSVLSKVQGDSNLFHRTEKPLDNYFDSENCFMVKGILKKDLLKGLESRGITKSFLFPDNNRSLGKIAQKFKEQVFPKITLK